MNKFIVTLFILFGIMVMVVPMKIIFDDFTDPTTGLITIANGFPEWAVFLWQSMPTLLPLCLIGWLIYFIGKGSDKPTA